MFGNPHSTSPSSAASTALADEARAAILAWLGASPDEYVVIFTANASAALKLVGEAFPFRAGSRYLLSADDHNSVNGIREFARRRGATVTYLPLRVPDLRLDHAEVRAELARPRPAAPSLFAYPAQSNYSGVQHPLAWIGAAREHGWRVLLDAAAFLPTNRLDIGRWQPDFVSISWYKLFGYPTGLGALVARREALAELERPWFAGGSIGVASVAEPRHTWAPAEAGFEDGTIDYLGIPAVTIGLRHLDGVGIETLTGRVRVLTRRLLDGLASLRHPDGSPLIRIYGPRDVTERGGTVPFNVIDPSGAVVDVPLVEARAAAWGSPSGPAASAIRVRARLRAGSPETTCGGCSRWATSRRSRSCARSCRARRWARSAHPWASRRSIVTSTACSRSWPRSPTTEGPSGRDAPSRIVPWHRRARERPGTARPWPLRAPDAALNEWQPAPPVPGCRREREPASRPARRRTPRRGRRRPRASMRRRTGTGRRGSTGPAPSG